MDEQPQTPQGPVQVALTLAGAVAVGLVVADYLRFRWGWSPVEEAERALRRARGAGS